MEKLELILTKYILGFTLQSFLLVFGVYTFNRQKVVRKEYLLTVFMVANVTFFMKLLPISVGVQTIMNMIFMYLVSVTYLKMQPYITIRSTALCVVLILLSEIIVTAAVVAIYGNAEFLNIANNPHKRHYIGVMANMVFGVMVLSASFLMKRRGEYHRSISK